MSTPQKSKHRARRVRMPLGLSVAALARRLDRPRTTVSSAVNGSRHFPQLEREIRAELRRARNGR